MRYDRDYSYIKAYPAVYLFKAILESSRSETKFLACYSCCSSDFLNRFVPESFSTLSFVSVNTTDKTLIESTAAGEIFSYHNVNVRSLLIKSSFMVTRALNFWIQDGVIIRLNSKKFFFDTNLPN